MHNGSPSLEAAISAIDLFDHGQIEWQRVQRSVYLLHQHLHYEYPGPIYDLDQRLMILSPDWHGNQSLLDYRLGVCAEHFEMSSHNDGFGNKEIRLAVPQVEQAIDFEAWILVERFAGHTPHYISSDWLTDPRILEPSPLTQPDAALRRAATTLLASGAQGKSLARKINSWTYRALRYAHDVTDIHTTAAEALALGQGVCQDYAHIMITLCRLCHLPARYVSGHMLGEGGTHAWVEVLLPVTERPDIARVVAFDPTHRREVGLSYLTIAVGRDYYDVAPTSGTFRAAYRGQLTARKRVGLASLEYMEAAS